MSKPIDRMVYKKEDKWINKANGNSKASSTHDTQKEAVNSARSMLEKSGGGELTIKGKNQLIRQKNTIPVGNDPKSTKG